MRLCFKDHRFKEHWKICGILARPALENPFVLVKSFPHSILRRSIIGGMATKEKKPCLSTSGNYHLENSWDITSKFGQTDTLSSLKSRDPLCHLSAQKESSSLQTIPFRNVSDLTQLCWQLSNEDSLKSISTNNLTDTWSNATDDWYWCDSD